MAGIARRIGAPAAMRLRVGLAAVILAAALPTYFFFTGASPHMPNPRQLAWLAFSGLAGMALGDGLFYGALTRLGGRRSIQIVTLAPVAALFVAWAVMREVVSTRAMAGVALVLAGTSYAVLRGRRVTPPNGEGDAPPRLASREPGEVTLAGLAFGVGGAIGLGVGAVASREAYFAGPPLDPLVATTVRVVAAAVFLWALPVARLRVADTFGHLREPLVRRRIVVAALLGPLLGMVSYVTALKYVEAGLVSAMVATSPLFAMPMVAVRYRARMAADVMFAAAVAVAGVAMISLR